jgi:hypothetical protein
LKRIRYKVREGIEISSDVELDVEDPEHLKIKLAREKDEKEIASVESRLGVLVLENGTIVELLQVEEGDKGDKGDKNYETGGSALINADKGSAASVDRPKRPSSSESRKTVTDNSNDGQAIVAKKKSNSTEPGLPEDMIEDVAVSQIDDSANSNSSFSKRKFMQSVSRIHMLNTTVKKQLGTYEADESHPILRKKMVKQIYQRNKLLGHVPQVLAHSHLSVRSHPGLLMVRIVS